MAKSKKELDKDLMFKKIMPALAENPFSSDNVKQSELDIAFNADYNSLSALRDKLFARSSGSDASSVATINVMESLVLQHLDTVISKFNSCSCDKCRCDIAAYALNLLPPKYIVEDPANIASISNEISSKLVMDALIKAVIQVRANPRH